MTIGRSTVSTAVIGVTLSLIGAVGSCLAGDLVTKKNNHGDWEFTFLY